MVAPAVANPYGLLKSRLVELLTPSVMERLNIIIWQPELMEAMLALLPPGEQPAWPPLQGPLSAPLTQRHTL